jgi:hypothetical protein
VFTDAVPVCPDVLDEMSPETWHHVEQHANNPREADHSQLIQRWRSMPDSEWTRQHRSSPPDIAGVVDHRRQRRFM